MRFALVLLVMLTAVAITSANEVYYYLLPFEESSKPHNRIAVERAEINIEGDAFVFDSTDWNMRDYLEDRGLEDDNIKERLFSDLPYGRHIVVRTESNADFTVSLGKTKQTVSAKQAATGNTRTIADNYRILCLCLYYARLADEDAPGWAIFREFQYHFDDILCEILKRSGVETTRREGFRVAAQRRVREEFDAVSQQFHLFSGTSVIRRNLDLYTMPDFSDENARTIDIDSITGITVAEVDWKILLAEQGNPTPKLDPLARYVPEDQHFVVFPSAVAAMKVLDAVVKSGLTALSTPIPMLNETTSGADSILVERYLSQLGLTHEVLEKLATSPHIKTVGITGSDPYFKEGTDIAVLLETDEPVQLVAVFTKSSGRAVVEQIDANTVLLTNSAYQVERIKSTVKSNKSLAVLDEFRYFRDRYKIDDADETAFIFLSDATIRRWCSARWRIGQARRLQQQVRLAEITTEWLGEIVHRNINGSKIVSPFNEGSPFTPALLAEYRYTLSNDGVEHVLYGTFTHLTPIAELRLDKVSEAEKAAYEHWREDYEATWSGVFDPIGIRLTLGKNVVKTDLTVLPLNLTSLSEFGMFLSSVEGSKLVPATPHYDIPMQFIAALNTNSKIFQDGEESAQQLDERFTLSWIGNFFSVYFDEDPFWEALAKHIEQYRDDEDFDPASVDGGLAVPVVLEIDSADKEKLVDFIDSATEAMIAFSLGSFTVRRLKHGEIPYLSLRERNTGSFGGKLSLFIAVEEKRLLVSLNENTLKRALDRRSEIKAEWLGTNLGMKLDARAVGVLDMFLKSSLDTETQRNVARYRELFALYKLRYPQVDAIEIHERLFGERLLKPEEIVCPSPLTGIQTAEFGITFENGGLRARGEVRWGND